MPKSQNQKMRILYLMQMFNELTDEQNGITMNEIIGRLEKLDIKAERKTIYDDINVLKNFGMDIDSTKSNGNTYYSLLSRDFELPELKLMVDSIQGSKFITRKKSEALIKKIEGLCSRGQAKELQRHVYISNRIKAMNESIYYTVDDIHKAINSNRKISFKYYKWNARKEKELRRDGKVYQVSPWALTWDNENYYLICYDSTEEIIKHFRVDKMLNLKIDDDKREGEALFKNFDMALYSKETFGMYGGKEVTVRLLAENAMADPIIDRFGQDVIFAPYDNEHFRVNVRVKISPVFFSWLVTFGGAIRIEGPEEVKKEYVDHLTKAL